MVAAVEIGSFTAPGSRYGSLNQDYAVSRADVRLGLSAGDACEIFPDALHFPDMPQVAHVIDADDAQQRPACFVGAVLDGERPAGPDAVAPAWQTWASMPPFARHAGNTAATVSASHTRRDPARGPPINCPHKFVFR